MQHPTASQDLEVEVEEEYHWDSSLAFALLPCTCKQAPVSLLVVAGKMNWYQRHLLPFLPLDLTPPTRRRAALGTSLAAAHCTEFALDEVLKATNDWSDDNLLGSGAFEAPSPLSLKQRLDILIGIARGYEYLHSFDIVHRDIKPANVLITSDMQPKIADFGLVRVGEGTTVGTTQIMGTPGYVDPVYSRTSKATTTSDVYSFGVLMLVVLTGRPPLAEDAGETKQITPWASECLSSGDIASLKPPTMDAPEDAVLQVAQLAVSCTMERTAGRPSMGEVATQLQAVREEVAGKDGHSAAIKVDAEV
ncbi:unnamed protein product [Closterium sp. NIES-65]|nr:unnamed protein product [Closterium sp. NIES-65]